MLRVTCDDFIAITYDLKVYSWRLILFANVAQRLDDNITV